MQPAVLQTSQGFAPLRSQSLARGGPLSDHDKLVKQTQKWVAQSFFGTILKQMHDSPFKSDMLDGGRGGQAFGSLYDQQLADRMSRGVGHKLVNSIVRKIEAKNAYEKQKGTSDTRRSPLGKSASPNAQRRTMNADGRRFNAAA
jgi:Rod binding domain-containing protein